MRTVWSFHRRAVTAAGLVVLLVTSTAVVIAGSRSHLHGEITKITITAHGAPSDTAFPAGREHQLAVGATIDPPRTAVQDRIDAELAQAETPASLAAAEQATVPAPATSAAYPPLPTADRSDPAAYAIAFATELLDINFAAQARSDLLTWAESEEAPNTLPGIPALVAGKALVLSLGDPDLPGGSPSPTPSSADWAAAAQRGGVQTVSDVEASADPDWTQIISQGWQPRDPRMTIETVTGQITVTTNGQAAPAASFVLTLTLGSAAHVGDGYGAVAAENWAER